MYSLLVINETEASHSIQGTEDWFPTSSSFQLFRREQGWRSWESARFPKRAPGSNTCTGLGVIYGLSLLLVFVLAPQVN